MRTIDVKITADNRDKVVDAIEAAIDTALEECGSECERYAKYDCPTDTGLLKNSITYALHGKAPEVTSYHADSSSKSGSYSGSAPGDEQCVYIGTNVEYAPYVEMGSSHHPTPKPFLKPALENHKSTYQEIFRKHIGSADV